MKLTDFSYDYLTTSFPKEYEKWYSSAITFDERLTQITLDEEKAIKIRKITDKIRSATYQFQSGDTNNLKLLIWELDNIVHTNNWTRNYQTQIFLKDGNSLNLPLLINEIRNSSNLSDSSLTGIFRLNDYNKHFPHLYSVIKNIQNESEYPIYYRFWQDLYNFLNNTGRCSYDDLTRFYRSFAVPAARNRYKAFAASTDLFVIEYINFSVRANLGYRHIEKVRKLIYEWHLVDSEFIDKIHAPMQKMTFINLDKWRKLDEKLFRAYIKCYKDLEEGAVSNPADSMLKALDYENIRNAVQAKDYTSFYTIAREIGIFYQDNQNKFHLGTLASKFAHKEISYSDYLKHYILNTEFLINNIVIHPFEKIFTALLDGPLKIDAIALKCTELIPVDKRSANATEMLLRYINRAIDAGLIKKVKDEYSISKDKESISKCISKSGLSTADFEAKFIGHGRMKQEHIVKDMINRFLPPEILDSTTNSQDTQTKDPNHKEPPLNQILYGPPGTGKTYLTIIKALEIIGVKYTDYDDAQKKFSAQLGKRIEFVTMHPSFAYEDFIEGLKPIKSNDGKEGIMFDYKSGIFKEICKRAESGANENKNDSREGKSHEQGLLTIAFFLSKFGDKKIGEEKANAFLNYGSHNEAFNHIGKLTNNDSETIERLKTEFDFILNERKEDYSLLSENSSQNRASELPYKELYEELNKLGFDEILKRVRKILNASQDIETNQQGNQNFVLILDEINRANISRVFGEVITLIEDDKRGKFHVTLPSGNPLSVPPNLYIIGTMNTADKSIALVDMALRRRFRFVAMYPSPLVLENVLQEKQFDKEEISKRVYLMRSINNIIRHKKKIDFCIGHSYFMVDAPLEDIINEQIIPLLAEYFLYDLQSVKDILEKQQKDKYGNNLEKPGIICDPLIYSESGELLVKDRYKVPSVPKPEETDKKNSTLNEEETA